MMLTPPLFGIVPVSPRPAPLENVLGARTSACPAVPLLTVACVLDNTVLQRFRLSTHVLSPLLQPRRSVWKSESSPLQSGSNPPASAAATSLVCWVMNACRSPSSPVVGHIPPPIVSAICHLREYLSSHRV